MKIENAQTKKKPGVVRILRRNMKALVQFELFYKLLFVLVFIPLLSKLITLSLHLTGYKYVTVENFLGYIFHPVTLLMIFLLLVLVALFYLYDISAIIYHADLSYQNRKINVLEMFQFGFLTLKKFLQPKNFFYFLFLDFMIPFLSIGVALSYFRMNSLFDILFLELCRKKSAFWIFIVLILALWIFAMRFVYSVHYFCMEEGTFRSACRKSCRLSLKHRISGWAKLVLLQLLTGLFFVMLFVLGIVVILLLSKLLVQKVFLENLTLRLVHIYLNLLLLLFLALMTPVGFALITKSFFKSKELIGEECQHIEQRIVFVEAKKQKWLKWADVLVCIISIVVIGIYFHLFEVGKKNYPIEYLKNVEVTAHRGASGNFPENSRSAFEGAIEYGANWIELDVQQTKDQQIMIMHDTNLYRTAGVLANVWETTYEELQEMEIGSWFSTEFTGEPIMLLSEALEFAKENDIRLNIELKPTGYEKDFEKQVVDLVREYDFVDQCVVTSQVYDVLKNIKAYDEEIHTVYVMSVAYGDLVNLKEADGFSIKYSFITPKLVSEVHNAGKEIYAWTVNSEYQVNRMVNLQVDNIITDYVLMAKKCIYSNRNSDLVVELIDYILGHLN